MEDSVAIPVKHHRRFTARRGEVIEKIIQDAGSIRIHFPREDDGDETIKISGPRDAVEKAKMALQKRVEDWVWSRKILLHSVSNKKEPWKSIKTNTIKCNENTLIEPEFKRGFLNVEQRKCPFDKKAETFRIFLLKTFR